MQWQCPKWIWVRVQITYSCNINLELGWHNQTPPFPVHHGGNMVLNLNFNHFTQFTIQNSTQFFQITFAIIFQLSIFKFINSSSSLGHHYHHLHPIASVFLVPLQNNSHSNYAGRMQQLLRDTVVHTVLVKEAPYSNTGSILGVYASLDIPLISKYKIDSSWQLCSLWFELFLRCFPVISLAILSKMWFMKMQ